MARAAKIPGRLEGAAAAAYPGREPFFYNRFAKTVLTSHLAQLIGPIAVLLLLIVAQVEDSVRYSRPVTFFEGQLLPMLGVASWRALNRARRAAVDAGWLNYRPGGKGRPGVYWVEIPANALGPGSALPCTCETQVESASSDCETQPEFHLRNAGESASGCASTALSPAPRSVGSSPSLPVIPSNPPPPSREEGVLGERTEGKAWGNVEAGCIAFGVADAAAAVDKARRNGCTAQDLAELLEYARVNSSRWQSPAGALHHRMLNAWPGLPVNEGWPAERTGEKQRRQSAAAADRAADERREAERRTQADGERYAALEARAGASLDGMAASDRDELARRVLGRNGSVWRLYKRDGVPERSAQRRALLKAICDNSESEAA